MNVKFKFSNFIVPIFILYVFGVLFLFFTKEKSSLSSLYESVFFLVMFFIGPFLLAASNLYLILLIVAFFISIYFMYKKVREDFKGLFVFMVLLFWEFLGSYCFLLYSGGA